MTEQLCAGRVAIVTGAGGGLGREHALALVHHGARVVVNDVGVGVHGEGHDNRPAAEVVAEIEAIGGQAVANTDDIADSNGAQRLVDQAVDVFGGLDVVVNNAGILRDRMVVSMTDDDWDAVMRVHLRGTFTMTRSAAVRWRELAKAGEDVDARIINTSSPSGLFGNPGQSNYGAAKAGIAAFTVITAKELGRYGVTVNAVSPRVARTRMTTGLGGLADAPVDGFDLVDPANVSPIVVWLASTESRDVTGQVFEAFGSDVTLLHGWQRGARARADGRWDPTELGSAVDGLLG